MPTSRPILVVTGGSRGIGAAVCRRAATEGYDVAVNYQSDANAAARVVEDCQAAGVRAIAVQGDMASEADVIQLFRAVDADLGPVTHLVNNAGITGPVGRLDDADPAMIRNCINLNVTGAILVAQEAIQRMARRHGGKGGAIVNVSSAAVTLGAPNLFVWYAASKGAIDSLTAGLALELAPDGIRVNSVQPGMIDTEIHAKSSHDAGRLARTLPSIPMQRAGTADEVAQSILFLLSESSAYTTGAVLRVGGGR
jgi:NAD(P)-dependent dehydrogenase (short-subunit alcohol dehydrogenase family)